MHAIIASKLLKTKELAKIVPRNLNSWRTSAIVNNTIANKAVANAICIDILLCPLMLRSVSELPVMTLKNWAQVRILRSKAASTKFGPNKALRRSSEKKNKGIATIKANIVAVSDVLHA